MRGGCGKQERSQSFLPGSRRQGAGGKAELEKMHI